MGLKHIINWKDKNDNVVTSTDHETWLNLSSDYEKKSITRYDLILYAIKRANYNLHARSINKVIRNDLLTVPKGQFFTEVNRTPKLTIYLQCLHKVCKTHTAYALLALKPLCEFCKIPLSEFAKMTVLEYNSKQGCISNWSLPEWALSILDRQLAIAYKTGLDDTDPLFFVMRWSDFNKTNLVMRAVRISDIEITDVMHSFRYRYGYTISDYAVKYSKYCGLEYNAVLQTNVPEHTGMRFHSESNNYGRLVTVYEYEKAKQRRTIRCFGYLIWGCKGLYLVHTSEGILWCPYYLLGNPTVRPNRIRDERMKLDLHKLGYHNEEFYKQIKTHRELRRHTIMRRKI